MSDIWHKSRGACGWGWGGNLYILNQKQTRKTKKEKL